MCVILVCEKGFPDLKLLEACEQANPDGGAVAWVYRNKVFWQKGLTAGQIWDRRGLIGNKGCVMHFRIATVGGREPLLTHPFPITLESKSVFQGHANSVLFHNGHWSEWQPNLKATLKKLDREASGPMSDSRAMAIMCAHYGHDFAEHLQGQKIAILTPNEVKLYGQFTKYKNVLVSNTYFERYDRKQSECYPRLTEREWKDVQSYLQNYAIRRSK